VGENVRKKEGRADHRREGKKVRQKLHLVRGEGGRELSKTGSKKITKKGKPFSVRERQRRTLGAKSR